MTKKAEKMFNNYANQIEEIMQLCKYKLCTIDEARKEIKHKSNLFWTTVIGMGAFKAINDKDYKELLENMNHLLRRKADELCDM